MEEAAIQDFWERHPCGDSQIGGLGRYRGDYEAFFAEYDKYRYGREGHILGCLDQIEFDGRQVLEIGLGQGADSEQIIRRGADWSGIDLTSESVDRVGLRLKLRDLPHRDLQQGSVLELPHPDSSFDVVFSHGVLHHVPDVHTAQREIARVLRPGGELIAMLYARRSMNYLVAIHLVRRLGLAALYATGARPNEILGQHLDNARSLGLAEYLRMQNFIHRNTDGPLNEYSKVYDLAAVRRDFPDFDLVRSYRRFMHAPPMPVSWLPLQRLFGWHLWVHLRRR